jgi:hypothetical protein
MVEVLVSLEVCYQETAIRKRGVDLQEASPKASYASEKEDSVT